MSNMDHIVFDCLEEHKGGEVFFDALDEKLRNDTALLTMMLGKILEEQSFDVIAVSGHFGEVFYHFCETLMDQEFVNNILVVNGSLRKESSIVTVKHDASLSGKRVLFLDDSFYLGRTRDKINEYLKQNGATLIGSYVFYDGSKEKDPSVHSFYRYYDHFNISLQDNE